MRMGEIQNRGVGCGHIATVRVASSTLHSVLANSETCESQNSTQLNINSTGSL